MDLCDLQEIRDPREPRDLLEARDLLAARLGLDRVVQDLLVALYDLQEGLDHHQAVEVLLAAEDVVVVEAKLKFNSKF